MAILDVGEYELGDAAVYEDDYDFWGGEYDEYADTTIVRTAKPRIDFDKYGQKSNESEQEDVADDLPRNVYCDLVTTLNSKCVMSSLLEMWRYQEEFIKTASTQEILAAVNGLVRSPWYGYDTDYSGLLGGVTRDGDIVSAESALMVWSVSVPDNVELDTSQGSGVELELADADTLAWEQQFIEVVTNMTRDNPGLNMTILPNAGRSYGDISAGAISNDMYLLVGGYLIMFLYTVLMLGKIKYCSPIGGYLSRDTNADF